MSKAKDVQSPASTQEQRQGLCDQSTQEASSSVAFEVEQVHDEVLAAD